MADNTTHKALHSSTTIQAWETCVLYDDQGVWPITFTHKAHYRKCTGRQVPKLTSAQADKCPTSTNKPTSPLPLHWE